jgi:GABA(A) receptor-associated protein
MSAPENSIPQQETQEIQQPQQENQSQHQQEPQEQKAIVTKKETESSTSSKNFTFTSFHIKYTPEQRLEESKKMREKYSNRIPILVESKCDHIDNTNIQHKYLVPEDMTLAHFAFVVRSRISLKREESIFLLVSTKQTLVPSSQSIGQIHKTYNENGFLYITLMKENTFGEGN